MNRHIAISLFTFSFSLCSAFGAANDTLITFSTPGPDRYADGTDVKDGECYALVWTKAGAAFAGIAADGKAVGPDSKVLVFAPLAKNGRCPTVVFELDAELAASYAGGVFGVYLCDTRLADGKVGGLNAAGVPVAVNGYGAVKSGEATSSSLQNLEVATSGRSDGDVASPLVRVTAKSAVPEGAPQPQVTSVRVVGANVVLTVKGTLPCLQYAAREVAVGAASSPRLNDEGAASAGCGEDAAPTAVQGAATVDEEITVIVPKKGASGFYSVGRN